MTVELIARLDEAAARITHAVVAELYENPFWEERFGARGRRFSEEDGRHHLSYLCQALTSKDPGVLTGYARWLQSVLTSRGMCSRHLAENFRRLGIAVAREGWPEGGEAVRYLGLAEAALAHREGSAGEVQRSSEALARGALAHLGMTSDARCFDDALYHLSYLADALAFDRPDLFSAYCTFIGAFLTRRGVPCAALARLLDALRATAELDPALSAQTKKAAADLLLRGAAAGAESR